jgi:hypothetical protein
MLLVGGIITFAVFGTKPNPPSSDATPIAAKKEPPMPSTVATCKTDWHLCKDNEDLIKNHDYDKIAVRVSCKMAAEKRAKYGDGIEWPGFLSMSTAFDSFKVGDDVPKTGKLVVVDDTARVPNAFNTKVSSRIWCTYDLNTDKVTDILITER